MKKLYIKILGFVALFYLFEHILAALLIAEPSTWGRRILNQMYQEEPVTKCFIGGSQVLQGIDTSIVREYLGDDAISLTSSQQPVTATEALLRETKREHAELSKVYIALDYSLVMAEDVNLESIYIVADAMKPSLNKVRFLLKATTEEYYLNSFFPLRKGENYSFSWGRICGNLQLYLSREYWQRATTPGFAANDGMNREEYQKLEAKLAAAPTVLTEEEGEVVIPERTAKAIQGIISFCDENDMELVFIATPMPECLTDSVADYSKYVEAIKSLIGRDSSSCLYYDFNVGELATTIDRTDPSYFMDEYHLSGEGAAVFTKVLCERLKLQ